MKKNQYRILTGSLVLLGTIFPTQAANRYWDGTDTGPDADGGAGTWDTSTLNWDDAATAGANAAFAANDSVFFGGTGGTVSLAAALNATGVTVNSNGYLLQNNTLTVGAGGINVASGVTTTLASTVSSAFTKSGAGILVLNGSNSFTGTTVVSAGTLRVGSATSQYRWYRFAVSAKTTPTDGYNQICELAFYNAGARVMAPAGTSSTNLLTGEQNWNNANDNLTQSGSFTKFGYGVIPYSITYDYQTLRTLNKYNWATANDSTPARNPAKWQVLGSVDNTNFTLLDDRSHANVPGPSALYTWSASNGTYVAAANASPNLGEPNAFALPYRTPMPTNSPVQIAAGATFDVAGRDQRIASIGDSAGAGGTVMSSSFDFPCNLELGGSDSTTFTGLITDQGEGCEMSLIRSGSGVFTMAGSISNTYSGSTTLGDGAKLVLNRPGFTSIPHDMIVASGAGNGTTAGLSFLADEQIADSGRLIFPSTTYGGSVASNTWVHMQGHTETVRGVTSTITNPAIENRPLNDATVYGPARLIINTPGVETYSYAGGLRNVDGAGSSSATQTLAITKTGTGTQTLAGGGGNATGAGEVNAGVLRLTNANTYGGTMSVIGTGILEGTGGMAGAITVGSGGTLRSGVSGGGTFTATGGATIGSGGTLTVGAGTTLASVTVPCSVASGGTATVATGGTVNTALTVAGSLSSTGTLGNTLTVANGGTANALGTVTGTLTVQSGGALTVGTGIGTLATSTTVNLAGTLNMEVDKTAGVITNDKLSGFTGITYGGTLNLSFTGDLPTLGEGIQLFVPSGGGATFSGSFASITGLPVLGAGTQWDLSELQSTGFIRVTDTAAKPAFSPLGGDYMGTASVTITGQAGSTIYYTLDGTDPTLASPSSPTPATGITIPANSDVTVKAIAALSGFSNSAIVTNVYHTIDLPKWVVDASGDWGTTTNWDRGVTANGVGATADFTLDQTALHTVNVNLTRTVGKLVFGNSQSFGWVVGSNNSSSLILSTSSGTPEIEVREAGTGVDLDASITAPLGGTQGFTKTGAGNLLLSGAKSYSGTVAINQGILTVDSFASTGTASPLGTGAAMSMNGTTLRYSGAGSVGLNAFNKTVTLNSGGGTMDATNQAGFWFLSGNINGPGNLTKIGTRQVIVQASNTYDGQTFINEGEVQIRTVDSLGSTVGNTVVANGARLAVGAGFGTATCPENLVLSGAGGNTQGALQTNDAGVVPTFSGSVTLNGDTTLGGAAAGVTLTLSGPIGGTGNLTKVNNNPLVITGPTPNNWAGTFTMSGTCRILLQKPDGVNAVSGDITLAQLTWNGNLAGLVMGASNQIPDTAVITWGGTGQESFWRLNGFSETLGGLALAAGANGVIENRGYTDTGIYASPTITLNVTGSNSYSYNSTIRDNDVGDETVTGKINFVKNGTGTQELGGYKKNAGLMTVNAGTLILGGQNDYAGQALVNSGATLKGTPTGNLTSVTVNAGGIIAPGNNTTPIGTYATGNAVIDGKYVCEIDAATADRLTCNGNLDIDGATLDFDVINAPTLDSYIIASWGATGTLTGTFTVVDLPAGYAVSYDSTNRQVKLVKSGYTSFATANGLTGNANDDFDGDGLANGIEYVLGTVPTANSAASAPTAAVVGGNLVFTFNRADASMTPDTTVTVEVSSPLTPGSWTSYNVGATTALSSPGITVTDNGANDTITLSVPVGTDYTKFARLKVVVTGSP